MRDHGMQTGEVREDSTGPWEVYAIAPEAESVRLKGLGLNKGLWDTRSIDEVLAMQRPLTAERSRAAQERLRDRGLLPDDHDARRVRALRLGEHE